MVRRAILLIKVTVLPDGIFVAKVTIWNATCGFRSDKAVLGGTVEVPGIDGGGKEIWLPAGTSSGLKLRLRGFGASDRKGGRGDMYVVVQIDVPKDISAEARSLIERFAQPPVGNPYQI